MNDLVELEEFPLGTTGGTNQISVPENSIENSQIFEEPTRFSLNLTDAEGQCDKSGFTYNDENVKNESFECSNRKPIPHQ